MSSDKLPLPDVEIDDDGDLRFDWWFGKDKVLGLYITRDGKLGYAGILGDKNDHGEIDLPDFIKEFLENI